MKLTKQRLDMYEGVTYKTPDIKKIIDDLDIQHQKKLDKHDNRNDDGESRFIETMYSGVQHFGATDYTDHTRDTKKQLLAKIMPSVKGYHQRGHYYDSAGAPVKVLIVKGNNCGYTGWFIYASGKSAFDR